MIRIRISEEPLDQGDLVEGLGVVPALPDVVNE